MRSNAAPRCRAGAVADRLGSQKARRTDNLKPGRYRCLLHTWIFWQKVTPAHVQPAPAAPFSIAKFNACCRRSAAGLQAEQGKNAPVPARCAWQAAGMGAFSPLPSTGTCLGRACTHALHGAQAFAFFVPQPGAGKSPMHGALSYKTGLYMLTSNALQTPIMDESFPSLFCIA